jgi:hypothetical protein
VSGRPDWRDMRPGDFDTGASESVHLALIPAAEPCGTGDLFDALLAEEEG